ncbi:MAG: DUF3221 domain-containing protein [Alkalibacterium sp.]|nr:DUF3221 domain-containing protein [Alkalibacterium sp.]
MKKLIFVFFLVSVLSACFSPRQEGIIVEIRENQDRWDQILVVPNLTEEDIVNRTTDELIELAQENEGAYYSLRPGEFQELELEIGMLVSVRWGGSEQTTDPPQREATDLEIVSD